MDKAILTKTQADTLIYLKNNILSPEKIIEEHARYGGDYWTNETESLNSLSLDTLIRALYVGFIIEKTPEEKLKECYDNLLDWSMNSYPAENFEPTFFRAGITTTLKILGHDVSGITD